MEAALYASARKHSDWRYLLIDSKANAQALSFFGLTDKDVPAYVLHDAEQDFKYLSPNTKASGLDAFLDKFQVSAWHLPQLPASALTWSQARAVMLTFLGSACSS